MLLIRENRTNDHESSGVDRTENGCSLKGKELKMTHLQYMASLVVTVCS